LDDAGVLDEQALVAAIAARAMAAMAARNDQNWVWVRMLPGSLWERRAGGTGPAVERASEFGVDGLEGEPSAGQVVGVEPSTNSTRWVGSNSFLRVYLRGYTFRCEGPHASLRDLRLKLRSDALSVPMVQM